MSKRFGTPEARFHAQYIPEPNSGCWIWTGAIDDAGYGRFRVKGLRSEKIRVHRFSYEMHKGPIPVGKIVRHQCDMPGCVNPDHLLVGTSIDNVADKVARNRQARGARTWASKLTETQVLAVKLDGRTHRKIALDYGISHNMVGAIKRGTKWRHLNSM